MPEEYGSLKHKVPKEKGEAPNSPQAFKDFADSITKPPTGAKSQLAIVQSDGSIAYRTIKGDANFEQDGTVSITPNSVGSSEIVDGSIADTDLASPNNGVWKTIHQAETFVPPGIAPEVYILTRNGLVKNGVAFEGIQSPTLIGWIPTDRAVAGKTTKMRIIGSLVTNATAPTSTFELQMMTFAVAATSESKLKLNLSESGFLLGPAFAAPAAQTVVQKVGAEANARPEGVYVPAVSVSVATTAAQSAVLLSWQLQVKNV
jgi:hypothetical protein